MMTKLGGFPRTMASGLASTRAKLEQAVVTAAEGELILMLMLV